MGLIYALFRGGSAGKAAREGQFAIENDSAELPNRISSALAGCPTSAKSFEGWHIFDPILRLVTGLLLKETHVEKISSLTLDLAPCSRLRRRRPGNNASEVSGHHAVARFLGRF